MVILMFSNSESNSVAFQVAGVGCVVLSAGFFLLLTPMPDLSLSPFDALIFAMIGLSFLASAIDQDMSAFGYTIIFMVAYMAIMIMARQTSRDEFLIMMQIAIISIAALILVLYSDVLASTLTPAGSSRWELRWAPFEMHPNLAGFIYGGFIAIIANMQCGIVGRMVLVKSAIIVFFIAVILAASARGGLLAIVLTLSAYMMFQVLRGAKEAIYYVVLGILGAVVAATQFDAITVYLTEMLELNSTSRGLDSGGSGRVEIWEYCIDFIFSRSWEFVLGSGLRSATLERVGSHTESSYINVAIESGVPFVLIMIFYLMKLMVSLFIRQSENNGFFRLVFYVLLFAVLQSIVNRYLIAIGNPFSVCLLILASKASRALSSSASASEPLRPAVSGVSTQRRVL